MAAVQEKDVERMFMLVKFGKQERPRKIIVDEKTISQTFERFIAEPFERVLGLSIGNALWRILLSSLETPQVIAFRLEYVLHEFMAVEGITEDVTNIVLNVKGTLLRCESRSPSLYYNQTDIKVVDTGFFPVVLSNYYVKNKRVGQYTYYDRLVLDITTDNRLTPSDSSHFNSHKWTQKILFLRDRLREERLQRSFMEFSRKPIIETAITARDGHRIVIRTSKNSGHEEFFVDDLEAVSFPNTCLWRPKAFIVPASDYEVLETRVSYLFKNSLF
ncbi:hypothetical protein ACTFIR_012812 [Dictyostelium discoideum]